MIILKIGFTLDIGIIYIILRLGVPHMLLKPNAGEQLHFQIIKLGSRIPQLICLNLKIIA